MLQIALKILNYNCESIATKKISAVKSRNGSHLQLLEGFVALPSVLPSGPPQPFGIFPCDDKLWLVAAGLIKKHTKLIIFRADVFFESPRSVKIIEIVSKAN